ncbi:SCO family protein [Brevundimonas sp. 2R-24]|uniref:SCO family protein n=1 Tax=Peiella sedimenti TaxID=3061083 RepID=A0ABT8SLZ9_9CAUL|nr:SCO family protein [Caulobacteraceae bacterium XZ-24]
MSRRTLLSLLAGGVLVLFVLGIYAVMNPPRQGQAVNVASTGEARIGGPFTLVDTDGRTVDQSVLNGKWSVIFFGFTYCPDYCPATLQTMARVEQELGPLADNLQTVFISIDPERDTPQALKAYLASDAFPDRVVGLTGSPEQVAATARAYGAVYERVGEGDDYTMNHSLVAYLMDPQGRFVLPLGHGLGPERTAQVIRDAMERA